MKAAWLEAIGEPLEIREVPDPVVTVSGMEEYPFTYCKTNEKRTQLPSINWLPDLLTLLWII